MPGEGPASFALASRDEPVTLLTIRRKQMRDFRFGVGTRLKLLGAAQ